MYHPGAGDYDSPPPTSYLNRPWSPDPQDPYPSVIRGQSFQAPRHQTREAGDDRRRGNRSEDSMEALDLADYSRRFQPEYPPSPPPGRPFSAASRTTPSLVSSPDTLSSQPHSYSGAPHYNSRTPRHYSLPHSVGSFNSFNSLRTSPPVDSGWSPYARNSLDSVQEHSVPPHARIPRDGESEFDIAHFPAWSKHWYAKGKPNDQRSMRLAAEQPAFFDPTYNASSEGANRAPFLSSSHSQSARDTLPWGTDGPNYGAPLDDDVKEDRLRMLEREFGKEAEPSPGAPDARVVGSVDEKGRLVTQGPRKRMAARVLEVLLMLAVACSSLYAAVVIKPTKAPPPAGKVSTYVLYVVSIVSFLAAFYLFALRPCCCGRRKTTASGGLTGDGLLPGGLTVLPVGGQRGGKKGKKGKKGQQGDGVQVNLIVDPTAFMPGSMGRDSEEGWGDDDEGTTLTSASRGKRGRPAPRRRSVFEGLALERAWLAARKELKWTAAFDGVELVLWGAVFVWTLLSGTCAPGAFEGYCNAWNVAEAGCFLVALAFAVSLYFGIVDLHQSKVSPRTRP